MRAPYRYEFERMVDLAPKNWEILQLHTSNPQAVGYLAGVFGKFQILWQEWETEFHSAGAYLISRRGMEKVIAAHLVEKEPHAEIDLSMILAIGRITAEFVLFKRTASYTATIPLFVHDTAMASSIHPGHLSDHERGAATITRTMANVKKEWKRMGVEEEYPFALEKLDAL